MRFGLFGSAQRSEAALTSTARPASGSSSTTTSRRRRSATTVPFSSSTIARALTDAELRAAALYGPPDEIAAKVQALRDVGVEYLLVNSAGGIRSLRRFAYEIMPAFSGSPVLSGIWTGK